MQGLQIVNKYATIRSKLGFKTDEEFLVAYQNDPSNDMYTELFKLRMLGIETYLDEMDM